MKTSFWKIVFASLTGFIFGLLIIFLFFVSVIISAISQGKNQTTVKSNSVLELKLNGIIPERSPANPFAEFASENEELSAVSLTSILYGLDAAAKDKNIKGILVRADLYAAGMGTAEEIRNKIIEFRKSGKFAIAYSEVMTDAGYYISSACDKVYLNPKGMIEFNGFAAQLAMYKGLFDKMGVEFEVFKAGKYKGAVEPFIQNTLSEPNRQQLKDYVTDLFGHYIGDIARSRKLDSASLAATANGFLARNARKALEYKLVDALYYEDELETELKKLTGTKADDKLNRLAFTSYTKREKGTESGSDKIAVVFATGDIVQGKDATGEQTASETTAAAIKKARLDKKIKAVVLRVNSPGGSSFASDVIAREIELCKKVKPVIVSFGNVAASGGYYIACLADTIFAQPSTITGSIGVFALIPNTANLYKNKLGMTWETVGTGEYSTAWRPDEPLNANMRTYFQQMVNDIYGDFVGIVAKGRKMDTGRVNEIAQGHVYTGLRAKELGLTDKWGGLQRALQSAAWKAGIKEYSTVYYPVLKSPLEMLFGNSASEELGKELIKSQTGELYPTMMEAKRALQSTGMQMRMPWDVTVR